MMYLTGFPDVLLLRVTLRVPASVHHYRQTARDIKQSNIANSVMIKHCQLSRMPGT